MSPTKVASLASIFAVVALAGILCRVAYDGAPDDKGLDMVHSWLDNVMQSATVKIQPQKIIPIEDDDLQKVFPGDRFYGIHFATWPVAPRLPKELSYDTVVYIRSGESVEPIRDQNALRIFLAQQLTGIRDEDRASAAVLASLRLAEVGAKAGSYQFDKPAVSVVRHGQSLIATAQAAVHEPGRGEVMIRMEFDAEGKTTPDGIEIDDRSRRGPP